MKFPRNTTLEELQKNFRVEFCSHGPTEKGWSGHYLKCPHCKNLVEKDGIHSCECGNIYIDNGMLKIDIKDGNKQAIETYYVYKK